MGGCAVRLNGCWPCLIRRSKFKKRMKLNLRLSQNIVCGRPPWTASQIRCSGEKCPRTFCENPFASKSTVTEVRVPTLPPGTFYVPSVILVVKRGRQLISWNLTRIGLR